MEFFLLLTIALTKRKKREKTPWYLLIRITL